MASRIFIVRVFDNQGNPVIDRYGIYPAYGAFSERLMTDYAHYEPSLEKLTDEPLSKAGLETYFPALSLLDLQKQFPASANDILSIF